MADLSPAVITRQLLQVALAVPVGDFFDYLLPDDLSIDDSHALIGVRVQAPFGSRTLTGIVVGISDTDHAQVAIDKLKPIKAILDPSPVITPDLLKLANWLSAYYHYPLGETLAVMLPTLINQGKPTAKTAQFWQFVGMADALDTLPKTAKKQRELLAKIIQSSPILHQELLNLGANNATLTALQNKKLIQKISQTITPVIPPVASLRTPALVANDEQQLAIDTVNQAIFDGRYQGFLLNGVTGSGKTEVYLQIMQTVLNQGKQVLILVPEIGLTPQTKDRFVQRFNANTIVLHSNMTDNERLSGWLDCQNGVAQIIIGTRSSVLYPFANLGLIIVDESHDSSYKQQDHLRYHATDVALMRGVWQKIPVVLGTATPSLEQYQLSFDGKLTQLSLKKRAGNAKQVQYRLIDSKLNPQSVLGFDGNFSHTAFTSETIRQIRQRLAQGEQVLVFLNRRGYAPILICHACGWQADCPNCDAHLTLHKSAWHAQLKCHHCGHFAHAPHACPECNSHNLDHLGTGTARLVEQLHALFANPQVSKTVYPIWQIDRDTMQKKGAWQDLTDKIHSGEPAILVGTQMIAKGHHFPKVTLVVIVDADFGFLSPDFRSPEHTAQQIIQVAGRAGRADTAGEVLIQTLQPTNPTLVRLVRDGYHAFAMQLLQERRLLGLPPFSHAALIRAESHDYAQAKNAIIHAKSLLPTSHPFAVNAPIDAPLTKKNNRYQVQMFILSKQRQPLHELLAWWWQAVQKSAQAKGVRLSLDIDPMSLA